MKRAIPQCRLPIGKCVPTTKENVKWDKISIKYTNPKTHETFGRCIYCDSPMRI